MIFRMPCPHCRSVLKIKESQDGRSVTCPGCHKAFVASSIPGDDFPGDDDPPTITANPAVDRLSEPDREPPNEPREGHVADRAYFSAMNVGDVQLVHGPGSLPWYYGFLVAMSYVQAILGSAIIWLAFAVVLVAMGRIEGNVGVRVWYMILFFAICCWSQLLVLFYPALVLLIVDIGRSLRSSLGRR
jgi:predicted Zn finger-like uncharacterized protein